MIFIPHPLHAFADGHPSSALLSLTLVWIHTLSPGARQARRQQREAAARLLPLPQQHLAKLGLQLYPMAVSRQTLGYNAAGQWPLVVAALSK